jgi:hypothetical protein
MTKNSARTLIASAFDELTGRPHPSLNASVIAQLRRRSAEAEPKFASVARSVALIATTLLVVALLGLVIWGRVWLSIPIPGVQNKQPTKLSDAQAIQLALKETLFFGPEDFPQKPGRQDCTINGGGPYPGLRIPGSCQTSAVVDGAGGWLVTFTQYWDASRFSSGPKTGTLSYRLTYDVDANGKVTQRYQGGDYPPQGAY